MINSQNHWFGDDQIDEAYWEQLQEEAYLKSLDTTKPPKQYHLVGYSKFKHYKPKWHHLASSPRLDDFATVIGMDHLQPLLDQFVDDPFKNCVQSVVRDAKNTKKKLCIVYSHNWKRAMYVCT